jgi:hypothetical protein
MVRRPSKEEIWSNVPSRINVPEGKIGLNDRTPISEKERGFLLLFIKPLGLY